MNRYLVGLVDWLSKAFGGDIIWKFEIKPTYGPTIFVYLRKVGIFWIDYWVKLRERKMKN